MIQTTAAAQNLIGRPAVMPPVNRQEINRTFSDARLPGNSFYGPGYSPLGFGLDLNQDGRFNAKKDGVLSFDLNRDGNYSDWEIQQSHSLLKAFSGDFDANADGRVDFGEYFQGYSNYFQARSMDLDRDGVLGKWELQRAGASVLQWGQTSGNAGTQGPARAPRMGWVSKGLDNLPGGQSLDYVDPWRGTFGHSQRQIFPVLFSDDPRA